MRRPPRIGPLANVLAALTIVMVILAACGMRQGTAPSARPLPCCVATFQTAEGPVSTDLLPAARTEEERAVGLSGLTTLAPNAGMIFVYDEPTAGFFWMKDTSIPLSIAFVDDAGRVMSIQDMEPCPTEPCTHYGPGTAFAAAIEMNQGWFQEHGVHVGDTVTWNRTETG